MRVERGRRGGVRSNKDDVDCGRLKKTSCGRQGVMSILAYAKVRLGGGQVGDGTSGIRSRQRHCGIQTSHEEGSDLWGMKGVIEHESRSRTLVERIDEQRACIAMV